jgi:hypothetical protein
LTWSPRWPQPSLWWASPSLSRHCGSGNRLVGHFVPQRPLRRCIALANPSGRAPWGVAAAAPS